MKYRLSIAFAILALAILLLASKREGAVPDPSSEAEELSKKRDRTSARLIKPERDTKKMETPPPLFSASFSIVNAEGTIDSKLLKSLGLSPAEIDACTEIIRAARTDAEGQLFNSSERLMKESNEEMIVYRMAGDPIFSEQTIKSIGLRLKKELGDEKGELVYSGLHPSAQLGNFGGFDIKFYVPMEGDRETLSYECFDPKTGTRVAMGISVKKTTLGNSFGGLVGKLEQIR